MTPELLERTGRTVHEALGAPPRPRCTEARLPQATFQAVRLTVSP